MDIRYSLVFSGLSRPYRIGAIVKVPPSKIAEALYPPIWVACLQSDFRSQISGLSDPMSPRVGYGIRLESFAGKNC